MESKSITCQSLQSLESPPRLTNPNHSSFGSRAFNRTKTISVKENKEDISTKKKTAKSQSQSQKAVVSGAGKGHIYYGGSVNLSGNDVLRPSKKNQQRQGFCALSENGNLSDSGTPRSSKPASKPGVTLPTMSQMRELRRTGRLPSLKESSPSAVNLPACLAAYRSQKRASNDSKEKGVGIEAGRSFGNKTAHLNTSLQPELSKATRKPRTSTSNDTSVSRVKSSAIGRSRIFINGVEQPPRSRAIKLSGSGMLPASKNNYNSDVNGKGKSKPGRNYNVEINIANSDAMRGISKPSSEIKVSLAGCMLFKNSAKDWVSQVEQYGALTGRASYCGRYELIEGWKELCWGLA
ncbi:hypothetical protein BDZ45DRAFT_740868 [Acephala macrosclerotiorum]|nr:hypothetical protein BDZ45DRAFT_740868 [Acephala macrosclerotiorum]